jgi:hypothetical protein
VPKWEYLTWATDNAFGYSGARVIHVNGDEVEDERPIYEAFNAIGRDGWEMVNTMKTEFRVVFVFKRLLREPEDSVSGSSSERQADDEAIADAWADQTALRQPEADPHE